jgi:prepilin-type N-terminal cleavage/methylation domain-containing protein
MIVRNSRLTKGFSLLEILVAVGLIAVLMVVAVPRLLDLQGGVSDSASKQQMRSVETALEIWLNERGNFTDALGTATGCLSGVECTNLQKRVPDVPIVKDGAATGKTTNGNALKVGVTVIGANEVHLASWNGVDVCWAMKIARAGTSFGAKAAASGAECVANSLGGITNFQAYDFPQTVGSVRN